MRNIHIVNKPETLEDFRDILNNLIDSTENIDEKMGLKIILKLISHHRKEVIAYSLGKIYQIIKEEDIRSLIIQEIKKMEVDDNVSVRKSAEESMEMVRGEVNKYEIFELSTDILNQVTIHLEDYFNPILDHFPKKSYFSTKFNSKVKPKIKNSRLAVSWNDLMFDLMEVMIIIDHELNIFQISDLDVKDYYLNKTDDLDILPYEELSNIELTEECYLKRLIDIYALTFRETGHIIHLESLLEDDNYKIREMAINGLIYAYKNLTNFQENKPFENLFSEISGNINYSKFKNKKNMNKKRSKNSIINFLNVI